MYAIQNELGRFEADTERDAKRLLRKAKRAAGKQEAIDTENRKQARLKAQANGFCLLSAFVEDKPLSHAWIVRTGEKHFPVSQNPDDLRQWFARLSEDGLTEAEFYGYQPVAVYLGCDGNVRAIWTVGIDCPELDRHACLAVGCHNGQHAFEYLPDDLTPEWCQGE